MRGFFDTLSNINVAFAPQWLLVLAAAVGIAAVAVTVHAVVVSRLSKALEHRRPFLASILVRTRNLVRAAIVLGLAAAAVPFVGLPPHVLSDVKQAILIAGLFLLGWAILIACDAAAELYLRRFRIDVDDNLLARKMVTQVRILKRTAKTLVIILILALMLMTFNGARQLGVSLMASAGAAGLILGLAARPVLSNLIAGIQIAITQPIRVEDAVVVEGEWGWIEEITGTYVVIKIWDWRRLVVPLSYFIEKPFQNWTRTSASIIGTVFLIVDYTVPVSRLREKLREFAQESTLWDGDVVNMQVTETFETTMQIRILVSAINSPKAWDLRCEIREKMIDYLQREFPGSLPVQRIELRSNGQQRELQPPAGPPDHGGNPGGPEDD